ncbi:MAG: hypothetical protein Rubg2KO_00160 [Rubricoccaceae bacterium]
MRTLLLALLLSMLASSSDAQTLSGHRMIFAPTAKPVPAGQWSAGLTQVILPNTSLGMGGGVGITTGAFLTPEPESFWVEPKWTVVNTDEFAFAVGVSAVANPTYVPGGYHSRGQGAAVGFGVATFAASEVTDVTVGIGARVNVRSLFGGWKSDGIGRVRYDREFYATEVPSHEAVVVPSPVVFAGVEIQMSERVTWVSELGVLPDQNVRYSIPSLCSGCPLPPMPLRELPVLDRGRITRDVTLGTLLRYQSGRVGLDGGLVATWTGPASGRGDVLSDAAVFPWISGTVALTK